MATTIYSRGDDYVVQTENPALYARLGRRNWRTGECYISGIEHLIRIIEHEPDIEIKDDQLARTVQPLLRQRALLRELASSPEVDFNPTLPKGLSLREYQKSGLAYLQAAGSALIAFEQRLGKTILPIALYNTLGLEQALVVAPYSLRPTWEEHLQRWLVNPVITNLTQGDTPGPGFNIVHYDILHTIKFAGRLPLAIIDEAHMLRNYDSRRRRALTQVQAERRVALTGTPIANYPKQLLVVMSWLKPLYWSESDWAPHGSGYIHRPTGGRDSWLIPVQEVRWELESTGYIRRTQADVFQQLPPALIVFEPPAVVVARSSFPQERRLTGLAKAEMLLQALPRMPPGKKIIFVSHVAVLQLLAERLGLQAATLHGALSDTARRGELARWRNSDNCHYLIGTYPVMSMGFDLSIANEIILLEPEWSHDLTMQAFMRCSALGQREQVTITAWIAPGTTDTIVWEARLDKSEVIDSITERNV